jgi:hypothetical protein
MIGRLALAACVVATSLPARADTSTGDQQPSTCGERPLLSGRPLRDGFYMGLEPIEGYSDPAEPRGKWFHEVVITIAGGSVKSAWSPVIYVRGVRHESMSDGGFYYFEGCLTVEGDHYAGRMRLVDSDYVIGAQKGMRKTVAIKPLGADIAVDGKRYRRLRADRRR